MKDNGIVYLVGAGPGDPELLTKKGERLLKECQVVIYDRLANDQLLDLVPEHSERIYVGKTVGNHGVTQDRINEIIVKKALEGKRVVRLKGGDPFVFGRGGEEILALQEENISYEVVSGVTSAIAAAAYAGIPITHRGLSRSFHVITGHTADTEDELTDNYEALAKVEGTLVFLMGMSNLDKITSRLIQYGKDKNTPVAIISNGTTLRQQVVKGTLSTIVERVREKEIKAPAIIVVGEVAELSMKSTKKGRLGKKKIGITGTRHIINKLSKGLEEQGATVIRLGFSKIIEGADYDRLKECIPNIDAYTWIVFTSTNGVDLFFKVTAEQEVDYRKFSNIRFAVVGDGTRDALKKRGFVADYMPKIYTTRHLADGLTKLLKKEDRVLIPRATKGSKDLTKVLGQYGISYEDLAVYDIENDIEKRNQLLSQVEELDAITFASSSGVDGFFESLQEEEKQLLEDTHLLCIGDITAKTLESYGYKNYDIADDYSVKGMIQKLIDIL